MNDSGPERCHCGRAVVKTGQYGKMVGVFSLYGYTFQCPVCCRKYHRTENYNGTVGQLTDGEMPVGFEKARD